MEKQQPMRVVRWKKTENLCELGLWMYVNVYIHKYLMIMWGSD